VTEAVPRIVHLGDAALLLELGGGIDLAVNARALAIAAAIRADSASPWGIPVPAYDTVLVPYDPLALTGDEARGRLSALLGGGSGTDSGHAKSTPAIEIPVRYGGENGPDLDEVAERLGLSARQVVEAHAGTVYRVFFLGFAPGFGYLGRLPDAIVVPRRPSPRTRVPAGSVAIAGAQTGVYPAGMPGGWNLIGRTDAPIWDPQREPPALLRPGAAVRFVPVDA
jgi:KipI family sensor histidine kinase inhibitor